MLEDIVELGQEVVDNNAVLLSSFWWLSFPASRFVKEMFISDMFLKTLLNFKNMPKSKAKGFPLQVLCDPVETLFDTVLLLYIIKNINQRQKSHK